MSISVSRLDHLVLTVASIEKSCEFYVGVLGMECVTFGDGRKALKFGNSKINLHECGRLFAPYAKRPTCGSADLCFTTETPIEAVIGHLNVCKIPIEQGPVNRTGAEGALLSVYVRDPDGNLIEIANRI